MDWSTHIADLMADGWTQKEIADVAGCSQPTISDLRSGNQKDTRSEIALRLLGMRGAKPPRCTEPMAQQVA